MESWQCDRKTGNLYKLWRIGDCTEAVAGGTSKLDAGNYFSCKFQSESVLLFSRGSSVQGSTKNHPVNNSTSMQCHLFHGIKAWPGVFLNTNSSPLSYNYSMTHPVRRSSPTIQAKSLNVSSFSYCDDNHLSNVGHGFVENSVNSECSISDCWGKSNVANICANCCCCTCMISQNARPLISELALEFFKIAELLQDKTITQSSSIWGNYYYIHPHKYIMQKHMITSCLYIFACYSKWGSLLQIYCAHFDVSLEFIIGGFG